MSRPAASWQRPGTRPTRAWPSACAPSTRWPSRTAASSAGAGRLVHVVVGLRRGDDLFDYSGLLRYAGGAFEQRPALAAYAQARVATRAAARRRGYLRSLARAEASRSERRRGACGSAASRIARTTTTRRAPARDHLRHVAGVDPADREPGRARRRARPRGARSRARPPGAPPWSGVSQTGPTLSWSASEPSAASNCSGEWVDSPISRSGPSCSRASPTGIVVLAEVHAVGAAVAREVGPVVEPEQRAVLVAERAEARRRAQDLLVVARPCRAAGPCRPRRAARGRSTARPRPRPRGRAGLAAGARAVGEPGRAHSDAGWPAPAAASIGPPGRLTLPRLALNQRWSALNCG